MGCTHIGIPEWGLLSCVEANLAQLVRDQGQAGWLLVAGCYGAKALSSMPTYCGLVCKNLRIFQTKLGGDNSRLSPI